MRNVQIVLTSLLVVTAFMLPAARMELNLAQRCFPLCPR